MDLGRLYRSTHVGCAHHVPPSTDGRATVVRVVDGDTIVVHLSSEDETVSHPRDRHTQAAKKHT